jgi:hypothetical protein
MNLIDTSTDYKLSWLNILRRWMDPGYGVIDDNYMKTLLYLTKDKDRFVQINALDLFSNLSKHELYRTLFVGDQWFEKLRDHVCDSEPSLTLLPLYFVMAYMDGKRRSCYQCILDFAISLLSSDLLENETCRFLASEKILIRKVCG